VYLSRLLRDGWEPVPQAPTETWQRRHPQQPLTLVMTEVRFDFQAYGGPYVVGYAVRTDLGQTIPMGQATWADWDQRGRLIIAQQGRLFHRETASVLRGITDFNEQVPEPRPAPAEAHVWPGPPSGAG
jgi:hypothetical protein